MCVTKDRTCDNQRRHQAEAVVALQPKPMLDLIELSNSCAEANKLTGAVFRNLKRANLFPYIPLSLVEYKERFEVFKMKGFAWQFFECERPLCICGKLGEQIQEHIQNGLDAVEQSVRSICLDCIIKESIGATASVLRPCRILHS